jgi:hypothetical protein
MITKSARHQLDKRDDWKGGMWYISDEWSADCAGASTCLPLKSELRLIALLRRTIGKPAAMESKWLVDLKMKVN